MTVTAVSDPGQPTPSSVAESWLTDLEAALTAGRVNDVLSLFTEDCFWRDLVAFTWNITTLEGKAAIGDMLHATVERVRPRRWTMSGPARQAGNVTEASITFETAALRGEGILRLRDGLAWVLLTTAVELKGFEEATGPRRVAGTDHGARRGRVSWQERRRREAQSLGYDLQPFCLIVGGGQAGLALGATLRRLGVPALIVDRHERPGDAWRLRYESLCLHDGVWYNAMPYLPYPDDWPVFCPKDKMGDFLEAYASLMELNFWGGTECVAAEFDNAAQEWTVDLVRDGVATTLRPKHLILAVGNHGAPHTPDVPGAQSFTGDLMHSSQYSSGAAYTGLKCVVIGASNSGHDICQDLWEHGAQVTMVQRSSTHIVRSGVLLNDLLGALYSEEAIAGGLTTDQADLIRASYPLRILTEMHKELWAGIRQREAGYYERLAAVGFKLDFAEDGAGIAIKALRRGAGWYVDEGATELITSGEVGLRHGSIAELRPHSVILDDGTEIEADLVVLATGYKPLSSVIERLTSAEIAARIGRCNGIGSGLDRDPGPWLGEHRNRWTPTPQPNFWLTGGGLADIRYYSRFLGLQLKARWEKVDTTCYRPISSEDVGR
ncbi:NAD(P)/FAD-dependent oxidoreductase [Amycolatopsis pithecellobii]|uniref:SidA/IucD/PvdA family monooxygenase n=1 Tax=Amycolatopsis pithecellobii TaxID=664692 RepID=A0A6N7Z3P5_9PSEU|nr:NAD(P)/FAD-dependent oxidoreductase [Amycolatopsis pithecellobii]MTD56593.1 SidA/IucD/PvdA family monooxygenase [Amycolatopsis pithecellobii]